MGADVSRLRSDVAAVSAAARRVGVPAATASQSHPTSLQAVAEQPRGGG